MARKKRSYKKKTSSPVSLKSTTPATSPIAATTAAQTEANTTESAPKPELKRVVIRPVDVIEQLVEKHPELAAIKPAVLRDFFLGSLNAIREKVAEEDNDVVVLKDFGRFRINNVEKETDGKTETIRRVRFIPAEPQQ